MFELMVSGLLATGRVRAVPRKYHARSLGLVAAAIAGSPARHVMISFVSASVVSPAMNAGDGIVGLFFGVKRLLHMAVASSRLV